MLPAYWLAGSYVLSFSKETVESSSRGFECEELRRSHSSRRVSLARRRESPPTQSHYRQVLQFESNNYNARVFLALAQLNSGLQKESEINYEQAIDAQPDTPLAYQVSLLHS